MTELNPQQQREWTKVRWIAITLGVVAPSIVLVIGGIITPTGDIAGETQMVFYILLALAILDPLLVPLIEKFQKNTFRQRQSGRMSAAQLYTSLVTMRLSFVHAIFVYGLVVYILTGDFWKMMLFYPIGALWSAYYWPRRLKYEEFLQEQSKT